MFSKLMRAFVRSPMKIVFAGMTDAGKQRDHNEDAYALIPEKNTAVVADGMGGLSHGEVASGLVVSSVVEAMASGRSAQEGLIAAHKAIREASMTSEHERMGSTAVALSIAGDLASICWVGDSRAYLWRAGALKLLTRDHSFVNELLEAGAISPGEAEVHPNRHVLTRAVGIRDTTDLEVDSVTHKIRPGDRLLLCSDGLYGYLGETAVADCLRTSGDPQWLVRALIERTLRDSEAEDNLTVVCAGIEA